MALRIATTPHSLAPLSSLVLTLASTAQGRRPHRGPERRATNGRWGVTLSQINGGATRGPTRETQRDVYPGIGTRATFEPGAR